MAERRKGKSPLRVCKSIHECFVCRQNISYGQVYIDGGYGNRRHKECYVKESAESLKRKLSRIAEIIESLDNRCIHVDGPVTPTNEEITIPEIREIYKISK